MKKINIALFTAAAIGMSGIATAQTDGPNVSGRLDFRYQDLDTQEPNSGDLSEASSRLNVGGSTTGVGGVRFGYYTRLAMADDDTVDSNYSFLDATGEFGMIRVGGDDDLVYKYAGVNTDAFRGVGPASTAEYSEGYEFYEPSIQYHNTINNVTYAVFADTTGDDGIGRTQAAVSVDAGLATLGAVYSDREAGADSEMAFGALINAGPIVIGANVLDNEVGNSPFAVRATAPITDIFSVTLGHGDDDNGVSSTTAMIMADLGGGLDVNMSYRSGDTRNNNGAIVDGDGFVIGTRIGF